VDEEQVTNQNGETNWMMLSPWWLAKFHYETYRRKNGMPPPLEGLGQSLLDTHNLGVPRKMLKNWMQEFWYNS
jgi:hypothetical protein